MKKYLLIILIFLIGCNNIKNNSYEDSIPEHLLLKLPNGSINLDTCHQNFYSKYAIMYDERQSIRIRVLNPLKNTYEQAQQIGYCFNVTYLPDTSTELYQEFPLYRHLEGYENIIEVDNKKLNN